MENANYTVNASGLKRKSSSEQLSFDENERFDSSKPYQPGPLKLQIKSIKNSTRTDATLTDNMILNDGEGRSLTLVTATVMLTWVVVRFVKRLLSFTMVSGVDFLWTWLKNKLGYANDHYETYITLGSEHPPFRPHLHLHRDDLHGPHHPEDHPHGHHDFHGPHHPEDKHHGHHKPPHGHEHHHGWPTHGWPSKPPQGSEVYDVAGVRKKPYYWYHPASKLFEQPTIQYLPHGTKYALYGFDQHQAYKYHKKYEGKFEKYKTKLYRKKTKKEEKAKRKKQKAVKKWKKRQKRRKKAQAFASRVKNWLGIKDKKKAGDDDDDGDGGDGDGGDDDDTNDDIGEGNWEKPSSELEHGGPPNGDPPKSQYTHSQDYDALPIMNNNQHFMRITGG